MIETQIFNRYLEVKLDIINNLNEVFKRYHTYTKKYRGNRLLDLNVGLIESDRGEKIIQIFIRHSGKWIKDVLVFNSKGIINNEITSNFLYDVK